MKIALLLIALGFGYRVYVDALKQRSKRLQRMGKAIGVFIMLAAFIGSVLSITFCAGGCSKGFCPLAGKSGSRLFCPYSAKSSVARN